MKTVTTGPSAFQESAFVATTGPTSTSPRVLWKVHATLSRREESLRKCAPMERDMGWVLGMISHLCTLDFGDLNLICKGGSRFLCEALGRRTTDLGVKTFFYTHSLPFLIV